MSLDILEMKVSEWGFQKGILPNPDPMAQYGKTKEEVLELFEAIKDEDLYEVKDAIGDIMVTLIMQTYAWDLTLEECLQQAYETISQRTGKMVDGVFVKDA
jgi:NTP pyrophosphatase (non-canonical NTP hydrolase)